MRNVRRIILLSIAFYLITATCFAFDFSIRPKGFVFIPMGEGNTAPDGNKMYNTGGGGELGLEIDFSSIWPNPFGIGYTFGADGGMAFNSFQGDNAMNVNFYSLGAGLGLYYFPLSRLLTRLDGTIGVYQSSNEHGNSEPGLFLRTGGEIGFRFTPGFTLAANIGWKEYREQRTENKEQRILNSGMYTGLTAQMTFQAGRKSSEGVSAVLDQQEAVYPAFIQLYQSNVIGNVMIRNNENAEIRDVRVSFRAAGYTASEFLCGSVSIIPKGRSVEIPLFADFSPEILRFTDNGRIIGGVVIRYTCFGREREAISAVTLATHNRNRIIEGEI